MSESPEFAALRRKRLYYEELAKRNREDTMSDEFVKITEYKHFHESDGAAVPSGSFDEPEPPPGLPPEFRVDWQTACKSPPMMHEWLRAEHARWRAALSEIAALNMQVVSNAKASEAERDRLRAVIAAKDAALVSIIESDNEVPGWAKQIAREARARR